MNISFDLPHVTVSRCSKPVEAAAVGSVTRKQKWPTLNSPSQCGSKEAAGLYSVQVNIILNLVLHSRGCVEIIKVAVFIFIVLFYSRLPSKTFQNNRLTIKRPMCSSSWQSNLRPFWEFCLVKFRLFYIRLVDLIQHCCGGHWRIKSHLRLVNGLLHPSGGLSNFSSKFQVWST